MDESQRFSVHAGVIILLACGVLYRKNPRSQLVIVTSVIGAGVGAVVYPRLLGLLMGYQAAMAAPPGRYWRTEFRALSEFYTIAPSADTIPRGAALGLLVGMAVGLWVKAVVQDDIALDCADTLAEAQAITAGFGLPRLAAECSARLAMRAAAGADFAAARTHVATIAALADGPHGGACHAWERLAAGEVCLAAQETEPASAAVHDALAAWTAAGDPLGTVTALELLTRIDVRTGHHLEAARLLGATEAERARLRWPAPPAARPSLDANRDGLEAALGAEKLAVAMAEGAAMDLKAAAAYARRGRGARRKATSGWSSLTVTELEVVRLVTEGLKNTEIAARLLVSPATIKTHVSHAFTKLDVRNRAELAAVALRQHAAEEN